MRKSRKYYYYVEGECERKIISTLKTEYQAITPGKVEVFNVVEKLLTKNRIMHLSKDTVVILVFDTDTISTATLVKNIDFLKKQKIILDVICVTQVKNFEDELIRSCNIKKARDLIASKSNKDFKRDLIHTNNLGAVLDMAAFDLSKFWTTPPPVAYLDVGITNEANKIKK